MLFRSAYKMKWLFSQVAQKSTVLCHIYKSQCFVSTISPLTSAFNTKPSKRFGFKFKEANVGLFNIPELTDQHGFKILEEKTIRDSNNLVQEACNPQRKRKMVTIFDELSDCICRVADMADFVRMSHPDQLFREAAECTCLTMSELVEKLNTNVEIHSALKSVIENGDVQELTDVDKLVAQLFMFDFEQSGIHLEESKRTKYVSINNALIKLSNAFMHGTQKPTPISKVQSLDEDIRKLYTFDGTGGSYAVSSLNSENAVESVREGGYRVFLQPNEEQEEILKDLLEGRFLLAKLTGFPSFAHRAVRGTLAETPENIMTFLEQISAKIKEGAQKEYDIMLREKMVQKEYQPLMVRNNKLMPWDPPYFTGFYRNKLYDEEEVSEYFSIGTCMDGLNNLFKNIFDVTLENVSPKEGEVWHGDIHKLAVVHGTEGTLGYIYCDFFERPGKPIQDCHFTVQGGRMTESGEYQLPVVVLHLNFSAPGHFTPSLLSPSNVENLFHEFGHAMHSMLGRTRYQHVTGTRTSIDFAEVPSVLMEYFATCPNVIQTFARHFKNGKPLDDATISNVCKSKRIFLYSEMQLQVFYAILDQFYHGPNMHKEKKSTTMILEDLQRKYYGIPYVKNTAWQLRFGHLVGYGGKYYSYLMSRAIASKIWREMFRKNPFDRQSGEKYRRQLLAHGGERHPSELIKGLLGEKPTISMMVDSLNEDLISRIVLPEVSQRTENNKMK